jgi:hypothetical protein
MFRTVAATVRGPAFWRPRVAAAVARPGAKAAAAAAATTTLAVVVVVAGRRVLAAPAARRVWSEGANPAPAVLPPPATSALSPTSQRLARWLAPEPTDAGWRQVGWLLWDWLRTWTRAARLLVLFVPLLCAAPAAWALPYLAPAVYRLLARTLELAGPTYIKLGQWASTRPDLFPDALCAALQTLHDQIAPHAFAATAAALDRALGRPYTEVFASVAPAPLGSGCIAQVHVGRLRAAYADGTTETDVAIKVVHPGTEKNMRRDLRLMLFGASMLEALFPSVRWLGAVDVVEHFAEVHAAATSAWSPPDIVLCASACALVHASCARAFMYVCGWPARRCCRSWT